MNYPDEDYVRYYTRDTVSWRALGWQGQTVLALMLHGKFDRSGVFECDGHDPSHAVTLVTGLPPEVTVIGLQKLLDSKTWILQGDRLVWSKFIEAQSCRRADRIRQQESREKRRNTALSEPVTPGDKGDIGHQSHTPSPSVTPSLAKPSLAKPKRESAARAPKASRGWTRFPKDFEPSDEDRSLAAERGVDFGLEFAKIQDHEFQTPRKDPRATLRNWLRNARPTLPPRTRATKTAANVTAEKARLEAEFAEQRRRELHADATNGAGTDDAAAAKARVQAAVGGLF